MLGNIRRYVSNLFRYRARMEWKDSNHLIINGIPLHVTIDPKEYHERPRQGEDGPMLLKARDVITKEASLALPANPKIFEMGIFKGGSVILYDQLFNPSSLVAIEWDPHRIPVLDSYIHSHGRKNIVKAYYGINQASRSQVGEILKSNFPKKDIDLVIDDASHFYEETRDAFSAVLPYVAPGGAYVIEDWGWAHWPEKLWATPYFAGKAPLTNLIFELTALCATEPGIIDSIEVLYSMVIIRRGKRPLPDLWDLRSACSWRDAILQPIP